MLAKDVSFYYRYTLAFYLAKANTLSPNNFVTRFPCLTAGHFRRTETALYRA